MKSLKTALLAVLFINAPVFAEGDSSHHSGQASKHSVLASAHGVAATAQVASAAAAVPLLVVGSTSVAIGKASLATVDAIKPSVPGPRPLPVTEVTITVDPAPDQVIITLDSDNGGE